MQIHHKFLVHGIPVEIRRRFSIPGAYEPDPSTNKQSSVIRGMVIGWWGGWGFALSALIIGVGIRFYLAYAFFGNNDQQSWEIVSRLMNQGENLYARQAPYPYSPLWAYFLHALSYGANAVHLPLHFFIRAFLTLVDVANAILVGKLAAATLRSFSPFHFGIYLINPVAIWIVGFHGQFDTLALLPLLIAVMLYKRHFRDINPLWLWFLGTLSLVFKQTMVFGVFGLFLYIAKNFQVAIVLLFSSLLVFLLSFVPFLPEGAQGVQTALLYQGTGIHGIWRVLTFVLDYLNTPQFMQKGLILLIYGVMMVGFLWLARFRWDGDIERSIGISFTAFLALAPSFSIQYLLLPVTWGSINPSRLFFVYTLISTLFATLRYMELTQSMLIIRSLSAMIWFCALLWFLNETRVMMNRKTSTSHTILPRR